MKPKRVDVFGTLDIEVYQNPERFLENNPKAEQDLVDVAQSAFTKEGVPTEQDSKDHLRVPLLVTGRDEQDYVAFSGVSRIDDAIYEVGLAVDSDLQGSCVGTTLLARGIMEEAEGEEVFGYRTQNPNMYACAENCFEVFPQPGRQTPESIEDEIQSLAASIDRSKQMDGPVMRQAYADIYDGGMYSEVPEHEQFKQFMYDELGMSFEDGDGLVVAGRTNRQEAENQFYAAAKLSDYAFREKGEYIG